MINCLSFPETGEFLGTHDLYNWESLSKLKGVGHPLSKSSFKGFPGSSEVKNLPANSGNTIHPWSGKIPHQFSSVQFSCLVVSKSLRPHRRQHTRPPYHHQLPECTQTHVHWVGDAIQPSHPLSPPSPPALNLSQHQGLFKWVSSSHQVAKGLEFQLQHQSFQWTPRTDLL